MTWGARGRLGGGLRLPPPAFERRPLGRVAAEGARLERTVYARRGLHAAWRLREGLELLGVSRRDGVVGHPRSVSCCSHCHEIIYCRIYAIQGFNWIIYHSSYCIFLSL